MNKLACVVQGNYRSGTDKVLKELSKHFDYVILSTWEDEKNKIPEGNYELVLSQQPENPGYSHRNFQRFNTYAGILKAKELGCNYVLKWRTDMLPTNLNVDQLLEWSQYQVPDELPSRLVTCAFRNLSVKPDWFSSIPDLFMFGHIDIMEMLWNLDDIDVSKYFNTPKVMFDEIGSKWMDEFSHDIIGTYGPETELYCFFKSRLQQKLKQSLTHQQIAKDFLYLFDHNKLRICWFGGNGEFRTIARAHAFPWWTEKCWKKGVPTKIIKMGYPISRWWKLIERVIDKINLQIDQRKQIKYLKEYLNIFETYKM